MIGHSQCGRQCHKRDFQDTSDINQGAYTNVIALCKTKTTLLEKPVLSMFHPATTDSESRSLAITISWYRNALETPQPKLNSNGSLS